MKLQHCVYVLRSLSDGNLYIGYTSDLKRRLTEHFHGLSPATAPRRPFEIIFCEYFKSKDDALAREGYFTTTAGKRSLRIMLRHELGVQTPGRLTAPSPRK